MTTEVQSVKSKQRMAAHGEVFTPAWIVEAMIDLIKDESARIDSRILEPACGSGNFLVPVLRRKLSTVHARYGKSDFERCHHALFALMSIYGIEILEDNAAECRDNLLKVFAEYVTAKADDKWEAAASNVLRVNIVNGDALSMTTQGATQRQSPSRSGRTSGKGFFIDATSALTTWRRCHPSEQKLSLGTQTTTTYSFRYVITARCR